MQANFQQLAEAIIDNGWYKRGHFKLSSGRESDFYIDLRPCMLSTRYVHHITGSLLDVLFPRIGLQSGDLLCGVITSGLFLTGAMLQRLTSHREVSAIYCRTEHRMHGVKRDIEGEFKEDQPVVLIDDVATSGKSLMKVVDILRRNQLIVKAALVVVDREEGARELLKVADVQLFSCLTVADLDRVSADMVAKKAANEALGR